jgi:hypothetical protein
MYIICLTDDTYIITDKTPDKWITDNPDKDVQYIFDKNADMKSRQDYIESVFDECCYRYGFAPSDLHRKFVSQYGHTNGHICEFIGIKTRNPKYPCQIRDTVTGKTYKVTPSFIRNGLNDHSVKEN